jgi:hypothetical protein
VQLVNGTWNTVKSQTVNSSSNYRVSKPADTDHVASYTSTRSVKVY